MNIAARLARQLAHPTGRTGRLLGRAMDVANRRPLRLAVDRLAIRPGEDVLDAGCGTGAGLAELSLARPGSLTGVDRSTAMLKAARRPLCAPLRLVEGDLRALPLEDGTFDAVLALNVLYFEDRQASMLRELHRVMRPGARLVAYVTHRDTMAGWRFANAGLHRLYDAGDLHAALADGGFAQTGIEVQEVAVTRSVRGLLACAVRGA